MVNIGKNIQYLRLLHNKMTQEELASLLEVSRQTVSKWELNQVNPELSKIEEICNLFNCTSDDLLFGAIEIKKECYFEITIEKNPGFWYHKYSVVSTNPEDDAINRVKEIAKNQGILEPTIIGWNFASISQEQMNVYHMHGYTAALVISKEEKEQGSNLFLEEAKEQRYVTLIIKNPMEKPFELIGDAYKNLFQYISVNRYTYNHFAFEKSFFKNGIEFMKIFVSIE